jgi:pentatricopeptide repeat protein
LHAEPLYQRAIEVLEKSLGPDHPDLAHSYNTLANLYQKLGNFDEAKSLYEKALEIRERVLGPDHNDVATSCTDLGLLCLSRMEYPEAEQYFRRALEITEKSRGRDHPSYANCLENLSRLFIAQGHYSDADSLLSEALRNAEKAYGPDHPRVAVMLQYSAESCAKEGRYRESEMLFEKSLDILERTLGLGHPKVARCLESKSVCYRLQDKFTEAISTAGNAFDLRWRNFSENSLVLPEREALAYSMFLRNSADNYLSCYIESDDDKALNARKTGDIVISSKGQVSDIILERRQRLSASTDTSQSALDDSYRNVKYRISKLYVHGPDIGSQSQYRNELDSLIELSHSLEAALARYDVDPNQRFGSRRVTLDSIAPLIPKRSILVEYLRFNYLRADSNSKNLHYVAVLATRDEEPQIIDLGRASEIDNLVNTYRSHMLQVSSAGKSPNAIMREDYNGIGRALYDLVWKPIESFVPGRELVLIAPDGGLNLISFAGLIDGSGKFLIENYPIHYLSAGRDLVRLGNTAQPGSGLLAIGDPDYDATASVRLSASGTTRSDSQQEANDYVTRSVRSGCGDMMNIRVKPLPGTRSEVEQIAAAWEESTDEPVLTYLGPTASEDKFKEKAPGKRVIHLATHGYYLQGACQPDIPGEGFDSDLGFIGENPLLQSGLFFAGANLHGEGSDSAGAEDGILTAYEVSAMELDGTQLVVLSACETGLGEVKEGEGVYGLRRAFQLAGARTVVSALWPVSDRLTAEMMGRLYEKADESLPRRMRKAQIEKINELRESGLTDHPFSWAGFIASGDWK